MKKRPNVLPTTPAAFRKRAEKMLRMQVSAPGYRGRNMVALLSESGLSVR